MYFLSKHYFQKISTKNYQFKDINYSLLFVLLPNILIWLISWKLNISRPLLNFDYLLPACLIILPFRSSKILGTIAFIIAFVFDIAMLTMQLFPFMDLAATLYLTPFLLNAPTRYIIMAAGGVLLMFCIPLILIKTSRLIIPEFVWIWCIALLMIGYPIRHAYYKEMPDAHFGTNHYFVAQSQLNKYLEHYGSDLVVFARSEPVLSKGQAEYATKFLSKPYSDKILLIVAESWGATREQIVQQEILKNIYNQKANLEFIKDGYFEFSGATVQGELRELCQMNVHNGYAFRKTPAEKFKKCLPNYLKNQGYNTIALHGASSQLYDRNNWYPKAGFQTSLFAENLPNEKRCTAFNGVCDSELFKVVGNEFYKNEKLFFYWITLTSHASYPVSDIYNNRLDCDRLQLAKGDICNNMRMHTQFFDDLAELIKKPEMKGVEVVVVGDHMPPIMGDVPLYKNLRWQEVSWLHFKVK